MEYESESDTKCNWCAWYSHERFDTGTGGLENKRAIGEHANYRIVEIGQNTKKSAGDLRWFAATQTPAENLEWKILKWEKW